MRWLIVEDSLESRNGHWFEYLAGFRRDLERGGDVVTLLASKRVEAFVQQRLSALPVLPESIFLKASDGAGALRRYARIPAHACRTWSVLRRYLHRNPDWDIIFVPTVIVHHLLAWVRLIKTTLRGRSARVLLFFPGLPIRLNSPAGAAELDGSPTSKLLGRLLRSLAREVGTGQVILGVETSAMREAATRAFGVSFTYFPHPVTANESADLPPQVSPAGLLMACYGAARYEKGSDVLGRAIEAYLVAYPASTVRFAIQWLHDFVAPDGAVIRIPPSLASNPRVEIIARLFRDGEYAGRLAATDVLLLPYRASSYALRVSRVVIEAMVHAKPVLTTSHTTLSEQAEAYGAGVSCRDGDVTGVVQALRELELRYLELRQTALTRASAARAHFSVAAFRQTLLASHPSRTP